jgi:hypothetical protein
MLPLRFTLVVHVNAGSPRAPICAQAPLAAAVRSIELLLGGTRLRPTDCPTPRGNNEPEADRENVPHGDSRWALGRQRMGRSNVIWTTRSMAR